MSLMIVSIYKIHISIKNQAHNNSDKLIKLEKIETKNILISRKIWFGDLVLYNIKEIISIEKFDDTTKTLIDTDDKLPDNITLKKFIILVWCVNKDVNKFYP